MDSEVVKIQKNFVKGKVGGMQQSHLDWISQCAYGMNMNRYSEVGETADVFLSFCPATICCAVLGLQCHEPNSGSEVGCSAAHVLSVKVT